MRRIVPFDRTSRRGWIQDRVRGAIWDSADGESTATTVDLESDFQSFLQIQARMERAVRWIGVVLVVGVLLVLVWNGDPSIAKGFLIPVASLILQISVLARMMAAFAAYANSLRRAMLILPHPTSALAKRWWGWRADVVRGTLFAVTLLAAAMLACRVDVGWVLLHWVWQVAAVLLSVHMVVPVVSRAGRWGWPATMFFWFSVMLTTVAIVLSPAINAKYFAAFHLPLPFVWLSVPDWILARFGFVPASLVAAVALVIAMRFRSIGWRRLRKVSHAFRNLPDRESVEVMNLNYGRETPRGDKPLERLIPVDGPRIAEAIAMQRTLAAPWSGMPEGEWKRWRRFAFWTAATFVIVMTCMQALNWINRAERPMAFAAGSVLIHVPMIFAIMRLSRLLDTRLVSTRALFQMSLSGLRRDLAWTFVLLGPAAVGLIWLTGRWDQVALEIGRCLLIGLVVRSGWIGLLRYRGETSNLAAVYYVFLFGSMGLGLSNGLLRQWLPMLAWPWWIVVTVPAFLAGVLSLVGWDRLVLMIRDRVDRRRPEKSV